MLIVPDVHGREFWKEPLGKYPYEEVIFLGDYLDPYQEEGITPEVALRVFREILDLKKNNPNRITLLFGNHDLMYISDPFMRDPCRHDWEHHQEISQLFKENLDSFKLIEKRGNFIFSHAGIHPCWLERHPEFREDPVESLNSKLLEPSTMISLNEFSYYRGGWEYSFGSPVWSDIREWINWENYDKDVCQIFGHTQLKDGIIIEDPNGHYKCIDCKHVIKIEDNKIEIL